ncbi:hypothetical protein NBH00_02495 [Paraconexibacter antarcticus]|uniref:Uncharacterized protein n=1 Tax=Paraconexibacter antarcticus TaxID=2949664 RepID=A0ABY5DSU1_9ACTN|nr:hypothetical protein [Paraconexibacter antarcticus]UTI65088.1 hypothetical protein NBH00_02495 [Paraconexibacter antarcticus]
MDPHPSDLIHIAIPGCPDDPRALPPAPPGVVYHYVEELHPDDMDVVDGIPVTSVARTLIDCAEDTDELELRFMFARAWELGILDLDALDASLGRVEWRPSLALVRLIADDFRAAEAELGREWRDGG